MSYAKNRERRGRVEDFAAEMMRTEVTLKEMWMSLCILRLNPLGEDRDALVARIGIQSVLPSYNETRLTLDGEIVASLRLPERRVRP